MHWLHVYSTLCVKITEVNLSAFGYRLFHEDFSSLIETKKVMGLTLQICCLLMCLLKSHDRLCKVLITAEMMDLVLYCESMRSSDEWREIFMKQSVNKCGQINFCNYCAKSYLLSTLPLASRTNLNSTLFHISVSFSPT